MLATVSPPLAPRLVLGWDFRSWSGALQHWGACMQGSTGLRVLELGCGPGGVSLWLASQGHRVLCSDLVPPGPAVRRLHADHGFATGIEYAAVDALQMDYEGAFDVVVTRSVLGGLGGDGRREQVELALQRIHRALRPGGVYLFAENLRGTRLHMLLRTRFRRWGREWHYFDRAELLGLLGGFARVDHRTSGSLGLLGWNERVREGLGALDAAVLDRLVPAGWRYVMFGSAWKAG